MNNSSKPGRKVASKASNQSTGRKTAIAQKHTRRTTADTTKVCSVCQQPKALRYFAKHAGRKDKLDTRCRECKSNYDSKYVNTRRNTRMLADLAKRKVPAERIDNSLTDAKLYWFIIINGNRCQRCKAKPTKQNPICIDHVKPLSRHRGEHTMSNLGLLCKKCNSWKRDRYMRDYRPIIWFDIVTEFSSRPSG